MKTVCLLDQCAGCMACVDSCPKKAIDIEDGMAAYNAVIDESKCINCNNCHSVCPRNTPCEVRKPLYWRQGWAENDEIRNRGSSGGVALAIETAFVRLGGIVCSCSFEEGKFIFTFIDKENELVKFTGSKYVKSDPAGAYKGIKYFLEKGDKVLLVALPCQIAAAKNFVKGKSEKNFFTIDLICHGTPSPRILEIFLKIYKYEFNDIKDIKFRTKSIFQLAENQKSIGTWGIMDKYSIAFLNSISYTENCYHCEYARKERVSDITLGDSWGNELAAEAQEKGVSLLLCQSEKGEKLLKMAKLHLEEVDIEKAIDYNDQLRHPSRKPKKRGYFFRQINKGISFNWIVLRCYPFICFKQFVKKILNSLRGYEGIKFGIIIEEK